MYRTWNVLHRPMEFKNLWLVFILVKMQAQDGTMEIFIACRAMEFFYHSRNILPDLIKNVSMCNCDAHIPANETDI